MKRKFKKKSFWISLAAGVTLLLQLLGVKVDAPYVNEVVGVACGILMLFGVISTEGENDVFGLPVEELTDEADTQEDAD